MRSPRACASGPTPCTRSTSPPDGRTRGCATSSCARSPRAWPCTSSTRARLDALAGHGRHQGVVAIVDDALPHVTLDDVLDSPAEPPLLVVLDGVTDPHNLGACLRSADAFGALAVVVPKDRAVGVNATVAKAACGAADTVPVIAVTNLARTLRDLKERGVWLLGADAGGESLVTADLAGPVAWVLGAEGAGLRRLTRESCDRIVGIPLVGLRREPQRVGRHGHLPVRDARRAHARGAGLNSCRDPPGVVIK